MEICGEQKRIFTAYIAENNITILRRTFIKPIETFYWRFKLNLLLLF